MRSDGRVGVSGAKMEVGSKGAVKRRRVARRGGTLGGKDASGAAVAAAAVVGIGTAHPRDVPRATTPSATLLRNDGGRGRTVPPGERLRLATSASAGGAVGPAAAPAQPTLPLSSAAAPTKDRRLRDGGASRERGVRLRDRSSSGGELKHVPRSRCGVAVTGRRRTSVWRWLEGDLLLGAGRRRETGLMGMAIKGPGSPAALAGRKHLAKTASACSQAVAVSSALTSLSHRSGSAEEPRTSYISAIVSNLTMSCAISTSKLPICEDMVTVWPQQSSRA